MSCDQHARLRAEARRMRLEGKSRSQIARALGLRADNSSLQRWIGDLPRPDWTLRPTAKDELRLRAIELRRQGMSYRDIAAATGASKGTLSLWLHDVEITPEQRARLDARRIDPSFRRRGWEESARRRTAVRQQRRSVARAEIRGISERELLVAGVIAYWAEGAKEKPWRRACKVTFTNSDPRLIELFLRWLDLLEITEERRVFRLQIHETADVAAAERYWAAIVGVPVSSFRRATLKRHNPRDHPEEHRGLLPRMSYNHDHAARSALRPDRGLVRRDR